MFLETFNEDLERNPNAIWSSIKANRNEDVSVPALMVDENAVVSDDDEIECFNRYFKPVTSKDFPHLAANHDLVTRRQPDA